MSKYANDNPYVEDLAETFVAWWFVRKGGVEILGPNFPEKYLYSDLEEYLEYADPLKIRKVKRIISAIPNRLMYLEKNMRCFVEKCKTNAGDKSSGSKIENSKAYSLIILVFLQVVGY